MTDLRSTQVAGEAWVIETADAIVSQALAEAWLGLADPLQLRVSQATAEVWGVYSPVTVLVASQVLAEVWVPTPVVVPPAWQRHRIAAQVA